MTLSYFLSKLKGSKSLSRWCLVSCNSIWRPWLRSSCSQLDNDLLRIRKTNNSSMSAVLPTENAFHYVKVSATWEEEAFESWSIFIQNRYLDRNSCAIDISIEKGADWLVRLLPRIPHHNWKKQLWIWFRYKFKEFSVWHILIYMKTVFFFRRKCVST